MRHRGLGSRDAAMALDRQNGASLGFQFGPSRRKFLQWLAMAGAGSILPANGLLAQSGTATAGTPASRIDMHHHFLPPFYVKAMEKEILATVQPLPSWTPAASIEAMDKNGIATAMLSPMLRVVQDSLTDRTERARSLARQNNEYGAQLVRDYPGRFGHFAALPLPDPEGSLREIEYAFDTLKADGIGLWTSYRDQWPGDPVFAPAFEELNRRKAAVFFHPAAPSCCRSIMPGIANSVVEYDFDTARAIVSLLANGALRRYPNIRFIFSHSGGTMPALANRVSEYLPENHSEKAAADLMDELKKLYYEVAHATYPAPLSALTKLIPTSQILFGSDYPIVAYRTTTGGLDHFGFSASDMRAINR